MQRANASRISRAHDAFNNQKPQSAKDSFKKRHAWGVGCMRWLGAAWITNMFACQNQHQFNGKTFFYFIGPVNLFALSRVLLSHIIVQEVN